MKQVQEVERRLREWHTSMRPPGVIEALRGRSITFPEVLAEMEVPLTPQCEAAAYDFMLKTSGSLQVIDGRVAWIVADGPWPDNRLPE